MSIKAYKGFCHDMTCRGFHYEEGKTYEMDPDNIKICRSGFHACLFPLNCLKYYHFAGSPIGIKYHEVEIEGAIDYSMTISECNIVGLMVETPGIHGLFIDDSKICGSKITVGKELSILDLLNIEKSLLYNYDEQKKFFDQFKMDGLNDESIRIFKSLVLNRSAKNLLSFKSGMTDEEKEKFFNEDTGRLAYIDLDKNITRSISTIHYVMYNTFFA